MSDFLSNLASRSLAPAAETPSVQPRRAARFEPREHVTSGVHVQETHAWDVAAASPELERAPLEQPSPAPDSLLNLSKHTNATRPIVPDEQNSTLISPPRPSPRPVEPRMPQPPSDELGHQETTYESRASVPQHPVDARPPQPATPDPVLSLREIIVEREITPLPRAATDGRAQAVPQLDTRVPQPATPDPAPSLREIIVEREIMPQPARLADTRQHTEHAESLSKPPSVVQPIQPQITRYIAPPAIAPHDPAASTGQTPAPTIQVTIGRIEVRATPAPSQRVHAAQQRSGPAIMTLEEYLRQRNEGGRR